MKWLKVKRFFIQLLRFFKIIPNVWYATEIELGRLKAEKLIEFFGPFCIDCGKMLTADEVEYLETTCCDCESEVDYYGDDESK